MKIHWIWIALFSGIIGGGITYVLTGNWTYALVSAVIIMIVVLIHNPATRYMRFAYMVAIPLLSNFYFEFSNTTDTSNLKVGLKEMDWVMTIVLGIIVMMCLLLDYLQRNGKLKGTFLEINKNIVKKVSGTNINIHQEINKTDTDA